MAPRMVPHTKGRLPGNPHGASAASATSARDTTFWTAQLLIRSPSHILPVTVMVGSDPVYWLKSFSKGTGVLGCKLMPSQPLHGFGCC